MIKLLAFTIAVTTTAQAQGIITTVAGTDWVFPGDGKPALDAPLGAVTGVVIDSSGTVVFADQDNCMLMRLNADGTVTVIAGNGFCEASGDGGPARAAGLGSPFSIALDSQGNLYVGSDFDIRKITQAGIITTIAGNVASPYTFGGDGGPATQATMLGVTGIVVDAAGNIYFSDSLNARVRKITPAGIISTFAGNGVAGFSGDGGPAASASLDTPAGLAIDGQGQLYIADSHNGRVRRVALDGTISSVVRGLTLATGLRFDAAGVLYVTGPHGLVTVSGRNTTLVAGGNTPGFSGDGGPATAATFRLPGDVALDPAGVIYLADTGNNRLRKIGVDQIVQTVAGNGRFRYGGESTPALATSLATDLIVESTFLGASSILLDPSGVLYIAESRGHRVRKVVNGIVTTAVGNGAPISAGDGGPAALASLVQPTGLAQDPAGNLYVSEGDGLTFNRIRKIAPNGVISTFADNVPCPVLATDPAGTLYGACLDTTVVRFAADGSSTVIAGSGLQGFFGDGGSATKAKMGLPFGLAIDQAGNVYISDPQNSRIRKVDPKGIISTIGGTGENDESTGDGGLALKAKIAVPGALILDPAGNLFLCDLDGNRVRKINTTTGIITNVAGSGTVLVAGDGKLATSASVQRPLSLALDAAGDLFILDIFNNRVREVLAATPTVQVPQTSLSLAASSGGAPVHGSLSVIGSIPGLEFQVAADSGSGPQWLTVDPGLGATPRLIDAVADPANLAPGTYHANITVRPTTALPANFTIVVTLTVGPAQPPHLAVDQPNLSFTFPQGALKRSLNVVLSNTGGGTIKFSAASSSARVSVSPAAGTVSPGKPASLVVTGDPGTLAAGTYTDVLTIKADNGQTISIPVTVAISVLSQALLLTQTGLSFTAVAQGGVVPPQTFGVVNPGAGTLSWTASTSTLSGGPGWLRVTPASGSSSAGSPAPQVTVTVAPAGLAPGRYYGLVQIAAPGAANTPQVVTAFLEVLPPGSEPGAVVQPPELVFSTTFGRPSSQELLVYGVGATPKIFRTDHSGAEFIFEVLPADGVLDPAQPSRFLIQPAGAGTDLYHFAPGTYTGTVTFQFADGSIRSVKVTLISVPAGAAGSSDRGAARGADGCSPSKLVLSLTNLGQSFSVSAGWPAALGVAVKNDCGTPLNSGSVTASFSNGDPPVSLQSLNDGTWQGTWPTGASSAAPVTIRLDAQDPQLNIAGSKNIAGNLNSLKDPPVLTSGSVGSAANFVTFSPLAPGGIISIYGDRLADDTASNQSLPLPTQLSNTQVIVAGQSVPLFFVSRTQINALMPFGINPNTRQQILVQNGPTYSQPVPVDVGPAQPAAFLSGGNTIAVAYRGTAPGFLVTAANPARAGDVLVIYCAGLGVTDQTVADGGPSPASPLAQTKDRVTVTIGGKAADVQFAGLAPGFVGLYQINAVVPAGVSTGSAVPLTLSVAGQTGPSAPIAIQ